MEFKGKLAVKARNGKGFKVEGNENWFNAVDAVVPYLAKIDKGTEVVVTYEKQGVKQSVTKIVASKVTKEETKTFSQSKSTYNQTYKSNYGSPEDVAGKEVGCAAGAAADILSGRQEDPDTLLELWSVLFRGILEKIREAK